ncbi:uncharacterized protein LOC114153958 [Xiphophorus couchianus]|uniref:uncharacterized protein LOC114153958 n=1 Tax=Xiphophorus couchianus TaxID=32473 RepID=UPI001016F556|nr:uncharacterized protein LOC114153958 [Xiphophorus couchianus]
MPYPLILPLGFGLGYLVTTGMRKVFDHYFPGNDSDVSTSQDIERDLFWDGLPTVPRDKTDPAGEVSSLERPSRFSSSPDVDRDLFWDGLPTVPRDKANPAGEVSSLESQSRFSSSPDVDRDLFWDGLPTVPRVQADPAGEVSSGADLKAQAVRSTISSPVCSEKTSRNGASSRVSECKSSSDGASDLTHRKQQTSSRRTVNKDKTAPDQVRNSDNEEKLWDQIVNCSQKKNCPELDSSLLEREEKLWDQILLSSQKKNYSEWGNSTSEEEEKLWDRILMI